MYVNPPESSGFHFSPDTSLTHNIDALAQVLKRPTYAYEQESCEKMLETILGKLGIIE